MSIQAKRLPFHILTYTSQTPDRRAQNLEQLDAHGYGWQTVEFDLTCLFLHATSPCLYILVYIVLFFDLIVPQKSAISAEFSIIIRSRNV